LNIQNYNILRQKTLIVFRQGDADSENFADQYLDLHNLDDSHKLSIPCSDQEIISSYNDFKTQVETPIKTYISAVSYDVFVIVLGYNVVGGFRDGEDIISSTSRLASLHTDYSKKKFNSLYDKQEYQPYEEIENNTTKSLITARIDTPSLQQSLDLINNAKNFRNQLQANGRFFIDPYSSIHKSGYDDYNNDLTDFICNTLPLLNLKTCSTIFIDPYIDTVLPFLQHDSFYWGWGTEITDDSFFRVTDSARFFLYNADAEGGKTLRSIDDGYWAVNALTNEYVCSAGALSDPTIDGYLRPSPFFNALLNGAVLGEAFLYACPFANWTIGFFGDPLVPVVFRGQEEYEDATNEQDEWFNSSIELAKAVAYYVKRENEFIAINNAILESNSVPVNVDLFMSSTQLAAFNNVEKRQTIFGDSITSLIDMFLNRFRKDINGINIRNVSINDFLSFYNYKMSRLLTENSMTDLDILDLYLYNEGSWIFEELIVDDSDNESQFYNFILTIATDSSFSNIIQIIDSESDKEYWEYEKVKGLFAPLPIKGISSSYAGRKIRYTSTQNEYLTRGTVYYFRLTQKTNLLTTSSRDFNQIIYT